MQNVKLNNSVEMPIWVLEYIKYPIMTNARERF